ncbi:hypothetical protein BFJ69_g1720 [Fusarium oxysporum]|uniref:AB hydrolase-1 domain-containing protein n=1 Tax=Fusarium oxysporum TaxID=5507 RepID=A0A420NXK4_FUSOX|nr:hypothetical protein BFJ69_g1720 [Fusarium oxysporum]
MHVQKKDSLIRFDTEQFSTSSPALYITATPQAPNQASSLSIAMDLRAWTNLEERLGPTVEKLQGRLNEDQQLRAFTETGIKEHVLFGWAAAGHEAGMLCSVGNGRVNIRSGQVTDAAFVLSALPEQWQQFYSSSPEPPFQSYWGMFGQNIHQEGVEVRGKMDLFLALAPIWRRILDLSREAFCGPIEEEGPSNLTTDNLVGRYVYVDLPHWGRTKLFYEQSGDISKPAIIFLHTAGSDGRQYHGVMNHPDMLSRCHMTLFDMPGHGRSFPSETQIPGCHSNNEDAYVGTIAAVIKALGLKKPIVCGASMAGHVSLAVAIRAEEVGAGAVIPCQAAEFTDMERNHWSRSPFINQSLFTPEYIYGMMSPFSPQRERNLVWHTYSGQAFGMYHGDLDFYFGGWDGRGRVEKIDTRRCPVYMLTGDYDWSTTPELSAATARKIPGAKFKKMEGLGHFPATENPSRFVRYLAQAVDYVVEEMKKSP